MDRNINYANVEARQPQVEYKPETARDLNPVKKWFIFVLSTYKIVIINLIQQFWFFKLIKQRKSRRRMI